MDPIEMALELAVAGAVALVLGYACFRVYMAVYPSIPPRHRQRVLRSLMTLPIAVIVVVLVSNPLSALVAVAQRWWSKGPSG